MRFGLSRLAEHERVISYVLPTRNRESVLARTMQALADLPAHAAEVIVLDNASTQPVIVPKTLANGLGVRSARLSRNLGAAARNLGVEMSDSGSEWIVMLDDDSHPLHIGHVEVLRQQPADVLAVAADIRLPAIGQSPRRESGGLPEVFTGCGAAIRRGAFLECGGYDASFGFYAEEYDLCARLIRTGGRVGSDLRFEVLHEKTAANRDLNAIVRRLVRNNSWVMARYAPDGERAKELWRTLVRYGGIARKEQAFRGYARGLADLSWTLWRQPRRELSRMQWERFIGLSACREHLQAAFAIRPFSAAAIVAPGKNAHVIAAVLEELGVRLVDEDRAEVHVVGTLSPGPMLDAIDCRTGSTQVLAPWWPGSTSEGELSDRTLSPRGEFELAKPTAA